jgi:hypothetical protein
MVDDSISISWESVYEISRSWMDVLLFGIMYTVWRWIQQRNSIKFCRNLGRIVTEISVWGRKHEPYTESPNSPRPKNAGQVKSKVKIILIIFFDIKGIVHKEFVLADQTVKSEY